MPIDPRMVKWDDAQASPTPQIDPRMVKWESDKPNLRDFEGYDRAMNYDPRDAIGGQIRGTASIGSTLLRPFESAEANAERRKSVDSALTSLVGSDPSSTQYQTNKLLAEVAGTAGVGGMVANGLRMIPGAANALPTLLPAIQSGGMSANGATGAYGMANRIAGGAVNAGATAGLVDPKDAKAGAMIGAVAPPVIQGTYRVANTAGNAMRSGAMNPTLQQTAKEAIEAGYVIPPNMVKPGLGSQVIESISGKQATQQIASTKNTQVTEGLVRQSLGIPADVPLTKGTLDGLRKKAAAPYAEVSALSPQAAADLEALKQARNDAQAWFKAYNRSASPADLAQAKQFRAQSDALEMALEQHAQAAGKPDLIPRLHEARKEIAKTYTVERALNDAAGTVDARVLGRMHEKGMPLSDGLDTAGKFASAFPTVAKSPQQVGSPAAHNLKSFGSLLLGGGGYAAMGPVGGAAAAVPFIAPPIARSIMFSKPMQRSLIAPSMQGPGLLGLTLDEAAPLLYRSGGLLATSSP